MSDATVHAGAVLLGETGALIRGPSGSGKSALLLTLLAADPAAHRLVADDRVHLRVAGGRLLAYAPPEIAGLLEIRGQGIDRIPYVSPVKIGFVIDLVPLADCPRMPSVEEAQATVAGVVLPRLVLPVGVADPWPRIDAALRRPEAAGARNP